MFSYKTKIKAYAPIKYPFLICKTLSLLASKKPNDAIIVCQSPPIFCPLTAIVYATIRKNRNIKIVIDAHTATFEKPWSFPILNTITRWTIRKAWTIIVTNAKLQNVVHHNYGVSPIVLEDGPLLAAKNVRRRSSKEITSNSSGEHHPNNNNYHHGQQSRDIIGKDFSIAVVSSFASDEPIQEIFEAARILSHTTTFYVTGGGSWVSARKLLKWKRSANNILFTGFLDRQEYVHLLEKVDAIMALTKREYTMLSGAHEALALGKPLITSDRESLKEYFVGGTVYIDNSVSEIVDAVKYVQMEKDRMKKEMEILRHQKLNEWQDKISRLKEFFSSSEEGRASPVA